MLFGAFDFDLRSLCIPLVSGLSHASLNLSQLSGGAVRVEP
jgi:hypothetical protein